jgi:hypothetical protein
MELMYFNLNISKPLWRFLEVYNTYGQVAALCYIHIRRSGVGEKRATSTAAEVFRWLKKYENWSFTKTYQIL